MGYGNTTFRRVFPVTQVAPSTPRTTRYYDNAEARTGTRMLSIDNEAKYAPIPKMNEPKYATEIAVTMAVVTKELNTPTETNEAYRLAKEWEKYQKQMKKRFFPRKTLKGAIPTGINFRPGYATK